MLNLKYYRLINPSAIEVYDAEEELMHPVLPPCTHRWALGLL